MKKNISWAIVFIAIAAIPAIFNLARFYTDWLWFSQLGYQSVFTTIFWTRIKLGVIFGTVFFACMAINLLLADRLSRVGFIKMGDHTIELPGSETLGPNIKLIMLAASAFLSFLMGMEAGSRWDMVLKYFNPTAFGLADPLFGRDISFYVFQLPFLGYLYQWATIVIFFSLIASAIVYGYKRGFVITGRGIHFRSSLYSHLSALIAVGFAIKSFGYRILAYTLLTNSHGFVSGAGYTDIHVRLPILTVLSAVSLLCAAIFLANIYLRSWKPPLAAAVLIFIASAAGAAYPEAIQRLRVVPNEISMERPYIKRQIDFTREAYDLNRIEVKPFAAAHSLSADQIRNNELTIKNIRLWDSRPLLQTYTQLQAIRTYYSFNDVDLDRYFINGEYRQVTVAARELSYDKLPARKWINERLSFTHGYGLCMSPVNRFTPEGMPDFFIRDIPPTSIAGPKIDQPQIYFGELSNDYVFVDTSSEEFDYPLGEKNVRAVYKGAGGVKLDSFFKKAAFAIRFSSLSTLLNTDINNKSRVMIYRNIVGTKTDAGLAARLMPLIYYDTDPYIVIDGGRLKWIVDGYTATSAFPYSQMFADDQSQTQFNYIRNSVKVVIDAYDGTADFYIFDDSDPIVKTYSKIFPGLFHRRDEFPESLRAHIRYPLFLFKTQTIVYSAYQMTDPRTFYNKEDLWSIPKEVFYQSEQQLEPYYTIMKLPGEKKEEYVLMMPFTPAKRDNLSAWMCARNDGARYGQLLVYKFPKKKLIFGPFQVEARIDQDPEISKQFSLWNQGGSQIIRGNMLVIPIEDSLLYVEPVYLKAEKGDIPELKRVVVSAGEKLAMGDNLELAIEKLLGATGLSAEPVSSAPATKPAEQFSIENIVLKSLNYLESAKQKARDLDWKGFGEQLDALEKTLRSIPLKPGEPDGKQ
jgi:uncharacterized protein